MLSLQLLTDRELSIEQFRIVASISICWQTWWSRTEPDLDVIKQVEQVTRFVWAGACQGWDHILISLMFGCKQQQKQLEAADGDPFANGQSGNPPVPPGGSTNRAT
jgi:hypothetical protein